MRRLVGVLRKNFSVPTQWLIYPLVCAMWETNTDPAKRQQSPAMSAVK